MSTSSQESTCDGGSNDVGSSCTFHELESDVETGDDLSMNFASGSVVFSVSGVCFKVRMNRMYLPRRTSTDQPGDPQSSPSTT